MGGTVAATGFYFTSNVTSVGPFGLVAVPVHVPVWSVWAWTGETLWVYEQRAATMSLVATAGGLIFGGDTNGRFRAFDQDTGEVLWEINLGSGGVTGFPITYAVDGQQYVAVSTGTSITTAAFGMLTPELRPSAGNNLFVFALP